MIRKAVRRSAVLTAGAGLLVAPMTVTAPSFTLAACQNPGGNYPQGINTQTTLNLDDSVGEYGEINRANADVSSNEGTPEGVVRFFVNGDRYAQRIVDNNGEASVQLPRGLRARDTHDVQARFISECPWNNSRSPRRYYTVNPAQTQTDPGVRDGRRGKFFADITRIGEGDGFNPGDGTVRFRVIRNSNDKEIRSGNARVDDGYSEINMRNLRNGNYTLRARFQGNRNFEPSAGSQTFSVG